MALFVLVASSLAALRPSLRVPPPVRASVVLVQPVESIEECIAAAENAAEAESCLLPPVSNPPVSTPQTVAKVSEMAKRSTLLGAEDSLQSCLASAEGYLEIDECQMDYDELVAGPSTTAEPTGFAVAPLAVVALAALVAFGSQDNLLSGAVSSLG